MERRLAAILSMDVTGYSRLMSEDEAGTLAALQAHRRELIDPAIARHFGRTIKLMSDGALVEFVSAVDAVAFAVAVQDGMARRNAEVPAERQIRFRIGINVGDVIVEGDDLYGDGVNLAARLEGLAQPGAICISGAAFDTVEGKLELPFEDAGLQTVKNIDRPVRVYRLGPGDTTARPAPEVVAPADDKPSLVVLPFAVVGGDPDQEDFADGITDDIITALARFQSIFVIARNTAFTYKGRAVKEDELGRELGVHYVVEGSLRRAGKRLRVNVQLVDTQSGKQVWAQRFDRDMTDIFELQDELTQSIVATLPGRVESADLARVRRKPANAVSVYDRVLKAKLCHNRGTQQDNTKALRLLDEALAADPEYPAAYAWKACTLAQAYYRGYIPYSHAVEEQICRDVLTGIALDDNDLECNRILCEFRIEQGRFDEADVVNQKSLRLNPNDPRIVAQRGDLLTWMGRPEQGLDWVRRAMQLDPYFAGGWEHLLGRALFGARRYAEALAAFGRVTSPRLAHHAYMAACCSYLEDRAQARAAADTVLRLEPGFSSSAFCSTLHYRYDTDRGHVRTGLREAGLPD